MDIVLECKPDQTLAEVLGYTRKDITHQNSRGHVINYLKKRGQGIGIVDEDPRSAKPTFFYEFKRETAEHLGVESHYHPKEKIRLIILKPQLEEWVIMAARRSEIRLSDFFRDCHTANDLHDVINPRLLRFEQMLRHMREQQNDALAYLKKVIDGK